MIQFAAPWVFLLLPAPLLVYFFLPAAKQTNNNALWTPFFERLQNHEHKKTATQKTNILELLLLLLCWILLVAATAQPERVSENIQLPTEARDLMLAVDISGSMQEPDMQINGRRLSRIDALKILLSDFIEQRKGDRIGLIVFGEKAYLHAPLTFDLKTVETYLKETQLGFAGRSTAIGDAIGLSIKRLQKRPSKQRTMILFTDGSNTAGTVNPIEAAKLASQENVKIYTIGIGSDGNQGVAASVFGQIFGNLGRGRELDESTLKEVANITGAKYFRAKNTDDLLAIYQALNTLEPVQQDKEELKIKQSLIHYPLALALLLSFILFIVKTNILSFNSKNTVEAV